MNMLQTFWKVCSFLNTSSVNKDYQHYQRVEIRQVLHFQYQSWTTEAAFAF